MALGVAGVAGCASSTASDVQAAVAPPTVTASQGATQIIATYTKFMSAYVTAYDHGQPDNKDLLALGGSNAAGLRAVIQSAVDVGVFATGTPAWSKDPVVQFIDANETIASVTFCFDPAKWSTVTLDPAGGPSQRPTSAPPPTDSTLHPPRPAYPSDAIGAYTVLMLMNRSTTGKWTVAQANAQPDRPCHLP